MWTLSKGIGLTGGKCGAIPLAFWWGSRPPTWQRGWWADVPTHGASHTVCIMTNHKNSHSESAVQRRGSLDLHFRFPFGWHLQVVVNGSIRRGLGTNAQVQAHGFSLAGPSHRFERYYCFERADGRLNCVCKRVRASFLKNICVSVHAFWPLELTVARRGLRATRGEKSIQWGIPIQIPI